MPEIVHAVPQRPHPIIVVREAVKWARAAGHRVRLGAWGIHCVSQVAAERWAVDPHADGIDPVAAAVLHYQPESTAIYEAASMALGAPLPWIHGLVDALDKTPAARRWAETIHRAMYAAGYEAGVLYRQDFIRARPLVLQ